MKNSLLILIALLLCTTSLSAQSDGPGQVVKTNPFGFFAGQYQFGYEHALSDKISVQMSAGIITSSGSTFDDNLQTVPTKRSGFLVIPEFRFYPSGNSCEGFYIGALVRYRTVSWTINDDVDWYNRNVIGGATVLGYQWYGDGMMVDFFLGPQLKKANTEWFDETIEEEDQLFNSNGGVRFGMNIGFGW